MNVQECYEAEQKLQCKVGLSYRATFSAFKGAGCYTLHLLLPPTAPGIMAKSTGDYKGRIVWGNKLKFFYFGCILYSLSNLNIKLKFRLSVNLV